MAIDTKYKKTALDEDASIYSEHKDTSDREKWKKMNRKERSIHFREYYLAPLLIAAAVIFIVGYLIYDAVSNYRDVVLMVSVVNDSFEEDTLKKFNSDVLDYIGGNPSKEKTSIEDNYLLSGSDSSDALSAAESITSLIYAKQLDAMIADPESFNHYASLGCFYDLRNILTDEQLDKYSDYLYYPELEEDNDPNAPKGLNTVRPSETFPCGILLSESPVYSSLSGAQPSPVLGFVITSKRLDNTLKFLEYLFPQ